MLVLATVLMMLISVAATISMAASSGNGVPNVDKVPILVKFKASAGKADIDNAIHSSGGESGRDLSQIRTHVIYVPANARDRILEAYKNNPSVERANGAIKLQVAGIPDDPKYAQQWALPKIAWDTAYDTISISSPATLAVLDTGVDATHPDLSARMTTGNSSIGGDPNADPNGHGTALAGIAAASVNNSAGIAGVSYASTNIMPVQVLQADGTGYDSDVIAGVIWAADNGANVILMGFSSPDYSAALADAIAYASGNGVVLVAATGNDGSTAPSYPAGMANVIGVAATDENDNLASGSNTGSAFVAAPGVNIYTTLTGGSYGNVGGTSAASAHVAGLAALLAANGNSNNYIYNQILGATDPIGQSFGRINVTKALGGAVTPGATPVVTATPTPVPSPTYDVTGVTPFITLTPNSGLLGTNVNVGGEHFHNGDTITIKFNNVAQATSPSSCTVSGNTFTCSFTVPVISPSSYQVTANDTNSNTASATFTVPSPPNITSFAPTSSVSDIVGATRRFNITVNQTVNVTWYINGTPVLTNTSVINANYTNTSAAVGFWNITAIANNTNGTASQKWNWNVTTDISGCTTISSPREYVLNTNINNASTCIKITSSNVTFDGAGYTINGTTKAGGTYGVYVYNSSITLTNVTVKNLKVTNWDIGILYQNAKNGSIENNTASSNGFGIILASSSSNNTLTSNNASSNIYGILFSSSSNNAITSNNASNNILWDFYSAFNSINNTVTNLTINPTISFTSKDVAIKSSSSPAPDPDGYKNISKFISATNNSADSWLFLNVSYSDSDVAGLNESSLRMLRYNGSAWSLVPEPNNVDTDQNYAYANITAFSIFAPMASITTPPSGAPNITSFAPTSPVDDLAGASRTFNITANQTVNVTWYINGTSVYTNTNVINANYTNTSAAVGFWNVTAIANNTNGTASQTWNWTVNNVAPVVDAGADATINEGDTFLSSGNFTDPGADTWTATVNYGDGSGVQALTLSEKNFSLSHLYADNGTYTVTVTVTDDDSGMGSDTAVVTVNNVAPTVSNNLPTQTTQYSDPIINVTISATDIAADIPLSASTSWKKVGDPAFTTVPSLPTDLILTSNGCISNTCTWNLSGRVFVAPANYTIRINVTDDDGGSNHTDVFINVTKEDARATYTGATFASTSSTTSSSATVTLAATIQDITAIDSISDPNAGNISKANVTFVNRDSGAALCSNLPVGLVNPADIKTGTATCNWAASISGDSQSFTVGIIVNNYYTRNASADDTVVTVSKPLLNNFITGGGYLVLSSSGGQKAGDPDTKNNFGFNVKYNKQGTNLQGSINTIVRRTESDDTLHVYQIKGNSMTSLAVKTSSFGGNATFNGKASIQDITNPLIPISVDGNAALQVTMTDNGEPGSNDTIGITVWNKAGGLWFASNWTGTKTVEQLLGGGNLVVH